MKYQRTFHASSSQEVFSDDKMLSLEAELGFLNKDIVASEKLDGGNACLNIEVFSRSHSTPTFHASFSKVKNLYNSILYSIDFDFKRYMLFGENMQALHSIVYDSLDSPFYLFAIFDTKLNIWLSYSCPVPGQSLY